MTSIIKFKNLLLIEKGFSRVTINGYINTIKRVAKELGDNPSEEDVESYMAEMYKKNFSTSYITNTSVIMERWMEFNEKPVSLGRPKKTEPLIPETLSEGETARLIASVKNIREKAIVIILAYSGIRNKELRALQVRDIDFSEGYIRVKKGKGNRDRISYLSNKAMMIIKEYLDNNLRNSGYLFTTLQGEKYSSWALRKLCKVLSKRANIEKRVYPHLFRHSLATNLLNRGCSLMTIKEVLGHKKIETTLRYAHSNPVRIRQEYNFYCPMYV